MGARQAKNAPPLWVGLFQMCFPDLHCYLSTFCTELNFSIKDSGSTASQPKIFCCVKDCWYLSSYLSPSQSPSLTSLSLSSSLCTATRCHDNRQFWSRLYSKFFFMQGKSKHLKGRFGPRVGDGNVFCTKGGQLGTCVGDVTFFAPKEVSWDPVLVT